MTSATERSAASRFAQVCRQRTHRHRVNELFAKRRELEAQLCVVNTQLTSALHDLSQCKKENIVVVSTGEEQLFSIPMSPSSVDARLTPAAVNAALTHQWQLNAAHKTERMAMEYKRQADADAKSDPHSPAVDTVSNTERKV